MDLFWGEGSTYAFQSWNTLTAQIGMVGITHSCGTPLLSGLLGRFRMASGTFFFPLSPDGLLTFPPCGHFRK